MRAYLGYTIYCDILQSFLKIKNRFVGRGVRMHTNGKVLAITIKNSSNKKTEITKFNK